MIDVFFSKKLLPSDPGNWTSRNDKIRYPSREHVVPPQDWYWIDAWHIDMSDLDHDDNNWQVCLYPLYSKDLAETYRLPSMRRASPEISPRSRVNSSWVTMCGGEDGAGHSGARPHDVPADEE